MGSPRPWRSEGRAQTRRQPNAGAAAGAKLLSHGNGLGRSSSRGSPKEEKEGGSGAGTGRGPLGAPGYARGSAGPGRTFEGALAPGAAFSAAPILTVAVPGQVWVFARLFRSAPGAALSEGVGVDVSGLVARPRVVMSPPRGRTCRAPVPARAAAARSCSASAFPWPERTRTLLLRPGAHDRPGACGGPGPRRGTLGGTARRA